MIHSLMIRMDETITLRHQYSGKQLMQGLAEDITIAGDTIVTGTFYPLNDDISAGLSASDPHICNGRYILSNDGKDILRDLTIMTFNMGFSKGMVSVKIKLMVHKQQISLTDLLYDK